jgi:hypothetical protein
VGLSTGACYDPYQMRHAYNIDTLINAGLDGKGKTIVIIDAFQSPTIVLQGRSGINPTHRKARDEWGTRCVFEGSLTPA